MKELIEQNLAAAIDQYLLENSIQLEEKPIALVERTKDPRHGDFSTNVAMIMAKPLRRSPKIIAEGIIKHLVKFQHLDKAENAGAGFINFYLSQNAYFQVISEILKLEKNYGQSKHGNNKKVLLEYVSSNPTGPIHIGHGRGAAYGSVLANLLTTIGYSVTRESYVNDTGRQIDILIVSVWLRYLQLQLKNKITLPDNAYHGQYVIDIANEIYNQHPELPQPNSKELISVIDDHTDEDKKLDHIINQAKLTLNQYYTDVLLPKSLDAILTIIKQDLGDFGVSFDNWFSEQSLIEKGLINKCIKKLESKGTIYEQNGAKWFNSSNYGDEKDRVVVRDNGQTTYFASDIAYHADKYSRGYDKIINIWGADHHGYISRVKGALSALGEDPEKLIILLVQFATLYEGKRKLKMSTRSGDYVTLKQLREEVGNDATRFFYVMRRAEQHLDFDLELAKSASNDNPVYYVQYAHARICSVFSQMSERELAFDNDQGIKNLSKLNNEQELSLMKSLSRYGEVLLLAAINFEPHALSFYLRDLANDFHGYYNSCQFLVDDLKLRSARLCLIAATRQVIKNGLTLLGVTAPEKM